MAKVLKPAVAGDRHVKTDTAEDTRFRRVVSAAGGDALVRALLPEFISRDPKEYDENTGDEPSEVVSDVDGDVSQSGGGDSGGA